MGRPVGDEKARSGLLSSLAEVAKRLLQENDRSRSVGGVSRNKLAAAAPRPELTVPVSAFRMVGLAEVQAKLGDRWPALAEKVHAVAQSTIARHLVRGDVFDRQGDDGYLVLFATLGTEEAEFKSRIIAREIVDRLLGDSETANFQIAARCVAIPAEALVDGDLELVVSRALDRAPQQAAVPDSSLIGPVAPVPSQPEQLTHSYSPVWDTRQMTLLHFRAHTVRSEVEFDERAREVQAYRADLALVRTVALDLQGLSAEGRRLPVTVALDHASLGASSQRANLLQALAAVPPGLRKILTLEISAPASGFWTYGCKAFLEVAHTLGVGASALVPLNEPQALPQAGALRRIATEVGGPSRREAASLRLLTAFAGHARTLGLDCAAYGLDTRALVLGAIGASFRYVAGTAVHPDVEGLATALRFEPLDLYRDAPLTVARA